MPFDSASPHEPISPTGLQALRRIRDFIASLPPERFDMSSFGSPRIGLLAECGTAACIAGWTCAVFAPATPLLDTDQVAGRLLGLDDEQQFELFFPDRMDLRTRDDAVGVLDVLLASGKVVWPGLSDAEDLARPPETSVRGAARSAA